MRKIFNPLALALIVSAMTAGVAQAQYPNCPSPWMNRVQRLDVNDDGYISPIDALQIINFGNANGWGTQLNPLLHSGATFIDPNNDGFVTEDDAYLVIDNLNNPSGWYNYNQTFDVDGNGSVNPDDFYLVYDFWLFYGDVNLGTPPPAGPYLDVDLDGALTFRDVLETYRELTCP